MTFRIGSCRCSYNTCVTVKLPTAEFLPMISNDGKFKLERATPHPACDYHACALGWLMVTPCKASVLLAPTLTVFCQIRNSFVGNCSKCFEFILLISRATSHRSLMWAIRSRRIVDMCLLRLQIG